MADMNEAYMHLVANLEELKAELEELKKSSKKDEKKAWHLLQLCYNNIIDSKQ